MPPHILGVIYLFLLPTASVTDILLASTTDRRISGSWKSLMEMKISGIKYQNEHTLRNQNKDLGIYDNSSEENKSALLSVQLGKALA